MSILQKQYSRKQLQELGKLSKYQVREITKNLVPAYRNTYGYHYHIGEIHSSITKRLANNRIHSKTHQSLSTLLSILDGFVGMLSSDSKVVDTWIDEQKRQIDEDMNYVREKFLELNKLHGISRQTSEIEWKRLRLESQQSVEDRVNALIDRKMNNEHEV